MTNSASLPWYRRVTRWGQTNITELDPTRYDLAFWREHWRRTQVQGVIINAGGIFTYYYPSELPFIHYAEFLNGRDLFGELVAAARQEGLAVLARMDSNRVHAPLFHAHPDWIAVDGEGRPYRAGDLYVTSVDSPYYQEYIPAQLREIASRYHPDGFTDNSFSGLNRDHIDYSPHAARRFREATGHDLPRRPDWDDPIYRQWIRWSYDRRLEIWDTNNEAAQQAGGEDCLWIGMLNTDPIGQGVSLRDLHGLASRARFILLNSQSRPTGGPVTAPGSFKANSEGGLLMHNLAGWDVLMPESMAMYEHAGQYPFRLAAKPEPEARLWALEGFAGTIQPWWHHIGAYHEDRRQYTTAEPLFRWHAENEEYLIHRKPVAPVGLLWSQENADFFGRGDPRLRVEQPWQGFTRALLRARVPYQPIHTSSLAHLSGVSVLILPNLGALSDAHISALYDFVSNGGSLIVTGQSARFDLQGQPRPSFPFADLLGVQPLGAAHGSLTPTGAAWEDWSQHSYLRLHPAMSPDVYGPHPIPEPLPLGERHPVLAGFESTNLLPFGGQLEVVSAAAGTSVPLTWTPPCPVYPPETAYMREDETALPALVLREQAGGGRTAYLAADLDRSYARNPLPDWQRLLANLTRWAAGESLPLEVDGPDLLDCRLYRQSVPAGGQRLILHLVNLTGSEPRPAYEFVPVGPLQVRLRLPAGCAQPVQARLLVAGRDLPVQFAHPWLHLEIPRIVDHEVLTVFIE